MICDKCGYEIPEGSKFCPECGNKVEEKKEPEIVLTLESEPIYEEQTQPIIEPEMPVEMPSIETGVKEWYFVEDSKSVGAFSQAEMKNYLDSGRINGNTFVWKQGMDEWKPLSKSVLAAIAGTAVVQPTVAKQEVKQEEVIPQDSLEWFYIGSNSQQNGPYTTAQMVEYIRQGYILENTYVWATGMQDWVFAKNSSLASYFTKSTNTSSNTYSNATYTSSTNASYVPGGIVKRNIALNIVLTIVTCGFYGIYWLYTMVTDVNKICAKYGNEQQQTSGGMVILLSIVTCGIYQVYWLYKCGKRLSQIRLKNGFQVTDDSVIMMILSIFGLGIVSYCILQSAINDVVTYAE